MSIARFVSISLRTIAASCLILAIGCTQTPCGKPTPTIELLANGHVLNAEVAATISERACGLSYRDSLAPDHGMLFVYEDERILSFWMKDTLIPLSIAFLNNEREILDIQQMAPNQTRQRYSSNQPARYALEVNQGWFSAKGIGIGTRLDFVLP